MATSLEQAHEETAGALARALQERADRRAQEDAEIEALSIELNGLKLALARRGRGTTPAEKDEASIPSVIDQERLRRVPRTRAILEIMANIGRPAGPAEIASHLQDGGREKDTAPIVSAALDHLKRQGNVVSEGRGSWVLTEKGREGIHR